MTRSAEQILSQLQPAKARPIGSVSAAIFYRPAKLLPSQDALLSRRKKEVKDAVHTEWEDWETERVWRGVFIYWRGEWGNLDLDY